MDAASSMERHKPLLQFRLRTILLVSAAACVLAYYDPWDWRSHFRRSEPIPLRSLAAGEVAHVDLIEINHFVGGSFNQLLFWSRYRDGELHIREWRLLRSPSMRPVQRSGYWECRWSDGNQSRCVRAPAVRETATTIDVELLDRQKLPKSHRVLLWEREPQPSGPPSGAPRTEPAVRTVITPQDAPFVTKDWEPIG